MRRMLLVFAATSLVVGLSSATAAPEEEKWARGTVSAMAADTLTVDVKGQPMTFSVDNTTVVQKTGAGTKAKRAKQATGQGLTLAEVLKVGDHVEVRYTETDGKMHATMVRAGISAAEMKSDEVPRKLEGVVAAITGSSLSVKKGADTLMFTVDPKTRIVGHGLSTKMREKKAEGAAMTLTDAVAVGDTVLITYKEEGDVKYAKTVSVVKKGT